MAHTHMGIQNRNVIRTRLIRAYVIFETTNSNGRIVSSTSCVGQMCSVSSFSRYFERSG